MAKVVNCPCGEKIMADTDDELVRLVQAHGKAVHDREVSRKTPWPWPSPPTNNPILGFPRGFVN